MEYKYGYVSTDKYRMNEGIVKEGEEDRQMGLGWEQKDCKEKNRTEEE